MPTLRRRHFLAQCGAAVTGTCLVGLSGRAQQRPGEGSKHARERIQALEALIPELLASSHVPGASVALIRDGKRFYSRGFGVQDRVTGRRVNEETVFEAASLSKPVFAYAALKLCERGVLGLDRPLTQDAPRPFLEGDSRVQQITPRHILSHSAGFQDFRSGQDPLRIHFPPGQGFRYSGEGYYYLQSVITHLTGKTDPHDCARFEADLEVCATDIDDFLKRNLLRPFRMHSSGYVWNGRLERHAAAPHDSSGELLRKPRPNATAAARYAACGGLLTTANDYAKFLLQILEPRPADAFRLHRAMRDEMLRPQIALPTGEWIDNSGLWGLGWAIQERRTGRVIVHSGGQAGYRCLTMASLERKSGFVIFTNGDGGGRIFADPRFAAEMDQLLDSSG